VWLHNSCRTAVTYIVCFKFARKLAFLSSLILSVSCFIFCLGCLLQKRQKPRHGKCKLSIAAKLEVCDFQSVTSLSSDARLTTLSIFRREKMYVPTCCCMPNVERGMMCCLTVRRVQSTDGYFCLLSLCPILSFVLSSTTVILRRIMRGKY